LVSSNQETVLAISSSEVQLVAWGFAKGDPRGAFAEEWLEQYQPTQVSYVSLARDGKSRSWWEAETGKPWPAARPIPAGVQSGLLDDAVVSPDGQLLVTYGPSLRDVRWLRVWNIESGKLLQHYAGLDLPMVPVFRPCQSCAAIAFSPDSRALAIGRRAEGLVIYEVESRRLRQELKTPAGSCARIAFLPDGKQLLTWGDKTMRVWDLSTGKLVRSFRVPTVNCWALTPDGRFVVVGGDGEFRGL
jgi:WD40 repeat protein